MSRGFWQAGFPGFLPGSPEGARPSPAYTVRNEMALHVGGITKAEVSQEPSRTFVVEPFYRTR